MFHFYRKMFHFYRTATAFFLFVNFCFLVLYRGKLKPSLTPGITINNQ